MPIIFFNIGWMTDYRGIRATDRIYGNFDYVKEHHDGYEQYNFLPYKDFVYGYAPIRVNKRTREHCHININNLGAHTEDQEIRDVTVVFMSKNPVDAITYIVGWYTHATVYREAQFLEIPGRAPKKDFFCKARAENAVCLPESRRVFIIPSAKKEAGGYGQTPVWYALRRKDIQRGALRYIERGGHRARGHEAPPERQPQAGRAVDPQLRQQVEHAAVDATKDFYLNLGFTVASVEQDNCGWDLHVYDAREELYVEVKGTAARTVSFELTPNEYENLKRHWRKYRIAVATNCLEALKLEIYSIDRRKNIYFGHNDAGQRIRLTERNVVYAVGSPLEEDD